MSQLFITVFTEVQAAAHKNSRDKGFWETERNMGESIALVHSEISEMWDGFTEYNPPSTKIPEFSQVEEEAADVVIRLFDMAGGAEWRLAEAIVAMVPFKDNAIKLHDVPFLDVCAALIDATSAVELDTGDSDAERVVRLHAEMSRMLEAVRHKNPPSEKLTGFSQCEEHAARVVAMLFVDDDGGLAKAILAKMAYNATRPHKHGKTF
ncbi:MAG: hypothetical protein H0U59_04215 [Gemmatimonadaceae bacterium]|nr:hypothetical protein [Gemmatimonadaceae bacterium]